MFQPYGTDRRFGLPGVAGIQYSGTADSAVAKGHTPEVKQPEGRLITSPHAAPRRLPEHLWYMQQTVDYSGCTALRSQGCSGRKQRRGARPGCTERPQTSSAYCSAGLISRTGFLIG